MIGPLRALARLESIGERIPEPTPEELIALAHQRIAELERSTRGRGHGLADFCVVSEFSGMSFGEQLIQRAELLALWRLALSAATPQPETPSGGNCR